MVYKWGPFLFWRKMEAKRNESFSLIANFLLDVYHKDTFGCPLTGFSPAQRPDVIGI